MSYLICCINGERVLLNVLKLNSMGVELQIKQ